MTMINGREQQPPQQPQLTSAQQLEYIRQCVKWTLWNIATGEDNIQEDGTPNAAAEHAQKLFQDPEWLGQVVGSFAANTAATNSTEQTTDYLACMGLGKVYDTRHGPRRYDPSNPLDPKGKVSDVIPAHQRGED